MVGSNTNKIYTGAHIHLGHIFILKKTKQNKTRGRIEYSLSHLGSEGTCQGWQLDLTACEEAAPGIR